MAEIGLNELSSLAGTLAHYLLIQDRSKLGIKRQDIVTQILQGKGSLLKDVLLETNTLLQEAVGYRVEEVPGKRVFILVNELDFTGLEAHLCLGVENEQIRGLLIIILSLILMKEDHISEDELWSFLEQIGVCKDDRQNPVLGDVEKLVKTTLIKQHYLEYQKDGVHGRFRWGFRSLQEFRQMTILDFVAEIFGGGRTAKDFSEIYKKLQLQEEERTQLQEEEGAHGDNEHVHME